MDAVVSLQELAIFELTMSKYKRSRLPELISDYAYKERKVSEFPLKDEKDTIYRTIAIICEYCLIEENLFYLKNRVAVCFRGLVIQILQYSIELAESLDRYSQQKIKLCVDSICINQNGLIDKARTLLTILINSEFLLEFNPEFFIHNLITKKDLIDASNAVLNYIEDDPDRERVAMIKKSIEDILVYENDFSMLTREYNAESQVEGVRLKKQLEYAASALLYNKNYDGVRKVCDLMTNENRIIFLNDNLMWLIGLNWNLEGEMVMYIFFHLPEEKWRAAVQIYFDRIFDCLIFDWKNRYLAVTAFQDAIDCISVNHMKEIFGYASSSIDISDEDNHDKFSITERINVLKSIWAKTPIPLRNDVKKFIKTTDSVLLNAEFLTFVIESYPVSDQSKIICKLMKSMHVKCERYSLSEYEKVLQIYAYLKTKSEDVYVDKNVTRTFRRKIYTLKLLNDCIHERSELGYQSVLDEVVFCIFVTYIYLVRQLSW